MAKSKFNAKTPWWPLRIERFDTTKHPVFDGAKVVKEVQVRLSYNEAQIIEGLANILECSKQQAIRIAQHSCHDKAHKTPERKLDAREGSRDKRLKVGITEYELGLLQALQGSAGYNLRHIAWHMSSLIKAGEMTRIPGCRRRSEKEKCKTYRETKPRSEGPSVLRPLLDRASERREEARDAAQDRYDEIKLYADNLRAHHGAGFGQIFGDDNGKVDMDLVMHTMDQQNTARENSELEEIYAIKDRIRGIKRLAITYAVWCNSSVEECMEQATEDWDAEHEEIDEDDLDLSWLSDLPTEDTIEVYKFEPF